MRMKLVTSLACVVLLLSAAATPLRAHHAFAAEFDANAPLKLAGVVTKWEWINPHSWINLDVTATDGSIEKWRIEGGAPNALLRRGWSKNSLPPGTEIVVEGFRAKDGSQRASGRDIKFPDGTSLFLGSARIGAPDGR